jgi:glutamate 5-kinase
MELARGIANYSSADAVKLIGKKSENIELLASTRNYDAFVTRDNIAFLAKNHD